MFKWFTSLEDTTQIWVVAAVVSIVIAGYVLVKPYLTSNVTWVYDDYRGLWVRTDLDCLKSTRYQGVIPTCMIYPCIEDCWYPQGLEPCLPYMTPRVNPDNQQLYCLTQNCQPTLNEGVCEILCVPCSGGS